MNIISQLKELAESYDIEAMDTLLESLSPTQLKEYEEEIIATYDMLYSYGLYDLDCNKVSDPENFIFYLLDIINSIQRFFPDKMYYQERGYCYESLAECAVAYEDKVRYIQQALQIYDIAPQTTDIQMSMVRALID